MLILVRWLGTGGCGLDTRILLLLILSAMGHATWNAIARRVEERDVFFTLITGVSVVLYAPLAIDLWRTQTFPAQAWLWVAVSCLFEILYVTTLAKAYRLSPLTVVYPVVRGTAPLLTTVISMIFAGVLLGPVSLGGILLITVGILLINSPGFSPKKIAASFTQGGSGVKWALLTGSFTACYNVSDSFGAQLTSGLLFKYIVFFGMFLGKWGLERGKPRTITPLALFKKHPVATILAALLIFGANGIGVYAMQSTAVAYVASSKEMSIVFATLIGVLWLKEKVSPVKWVSAAMILLGVLLIKWG